MEDAIFSRGAILRALSDSAPEFDFSDDFLFGGCWLETTDGSDFLLANASTSTLFDSSPFNPFSDINNTNLNGNPHLDAAKDGKEKSLFDEEQPSGKTQSDHLTGSQGLHRSMSEIPECSAQPALCPADDVGNKSEMIAPISELSRKWWIEPQAHPSLISLKERLIQALSYIKDTTNGAEVLVQVWIPIKRGGRSVLTTYGQPFWHVPNSQQLANYRTVSTNYQFDVEENANEATGLPGRVYLGRLPEWTPDVRYFSREEYPRVSHAQQNGVQGTLALPVFEHGSRSCLGVLEVVLTAQRINYQPELESICSALKAVDLRSSEVSIIPHMKEGNNSYHIALPEIREVLRAVCETQRLPLAQTWVPCIQQGKSGSRHSEENFFNCVSTIDAACHVTDPCMKGFHEACSDHHLFRGQGVAGKAFTTNQPCFSTDITAFSKSEYPLSHYARVFGLRAAVAIRLRSIYTGVSDYVLEFFLPVECRDSEEQKQMLNTLSVIIQHVCRSLRVVTDEELQNESVLPVNEVGPAGGNSAKPPCNEVGRPSGETTPNLTGTSLEEPPYMPDVLQSAQKGKSIVTPASFSSKFQQREPVEFIVTTQQHQHEETFSEFKQHHRAVKENFDHLNSVLGENGVSNVGRGTEKRRTKTEKNISLQVLRQYFAGSLKDAAKSIGVCPTTLKRICRQHGITRWPSRKIKKVGHSLRKLQVVIDSVQGADGAFQLSSLYANFPKAYGSDIMSPNISGNTAFATLNPIEPSVSLNISQTQGISNNNPSASKSPSSSCSQSSSSSLCCSSGAQKNSDEAPPSNEDMLMEGNNNTMLKRAYSEAELHAFIKEEPRPPARSHSHKSLSEHPYAENLSPIPKSNNTRLPRGAYPRVKVSYGEEKVRFSLQPSWGFQDLLQEVGKRFNMEDMSTMDLKYLDDDSEWVLLTCDADLDECKDIYKSSSPHAIKLSVHQKHFGMRNSLGSYSGLS
ncbi:protein NLP5-like [Aristolochia californica]|uniref:protein NLP5-like n=1 Tax=Aristolochia californica TaxID=171875 RepID=UPI0035E0614A